MAEKEATENSEGVEKAAKENEAPRDGEGGIRMTPEEKLAELKKKKAAAEAKRLAEKKISDEKFAERKRRAAVEKRQKGGLRFADGGSTASFSKMSTGSYDDARGG